MNALPSSSVFPRNGEAAPASDEGEDLFTAARFQESLAEPDGELEGEPWPLSQRPPVPQAVALTDSEQPREEGAAEGARLGAGESWPGVPAPCRGLCICAAKQPCQRSAQLLKTCSG